MQRNNHGFTDSIAVIVTELGKAKQSSLGHCHAHDVRWGKLLFSLTVQFNFPDVYEINVKSLLAKHFLQVNIVKLKFNMF